MRYDLISPIALKAWAEACAEGAPVYGDFNWERGTPATKHLNRAIRHIYLFLEGDRKENHLGHALWRIGAAIHSLALWPGLNRGTLRGPGCRPPVDDGWHEPVDDHHQNG